MRSANARYWLSGEWRRSSTDRLIDMLFSAYVLPLVFGLPFVTTAGGLWLRARLFSLRSECMSRAASMVSRPSNLCTNDTTHQIPLYCHVVVSPETRLLLYRDSDIECLIRFLCPEGGSVDKLVHTPRASRRCYWLVWLCVMRKASRPR